MTETLWYGTLKPEASSLRTLQQNVLACFDAKAEGMNATLACDELFTNIVMYSGASSVDVTVGRDERGTCVRLSDDGMPFDPLSATSPDREFEELDQGGMGIMLAKQACSDMDYAYVDGRNVLTLRFSH